MASGQAPERAEAAPEQAVAAEPVVVDEGFATPFLGGGMGAGMALAGIRRLPPRQRAAALARLSAGNGNAALARLIQHESRPPRMLQRDDRGGGMSSATTPASIPGTAPNQSVATPQQAGARSKIDDALDDFSQGAFRDVTDWSLASDGEKLKLLDKATDLTLLWVGPRDEYAIEACWTSFGTGFQAAVEASPQLWNRSINRGADPENIPQTKGKYPTLEKDILAVVSQHLDANEDKVVAEMGEFGLEPPYELLRADNPAKKSLGATAKPPTVGGPTPGDRLKEQGRLAKVLLAHKRHLDELGKIHVGLDMRKFDPGNKPAEGQDIALWQGLTSWDMVNQTWVKVTTEIGLIEAAWPALYAADIQGSLDMYANMKFDEQDPFKAAQNTNAQLEQLKSTFKVTLSGINAMRNGILFGSADALDFTPVHRALWANQATGPSGEHWSRAVWLPIMNDDREVKTDVEAAAKFAIDVVTMIAMIAGVLGTMGGAAIAIAVAGVSMIEAQNKAGALSAASVAAVSDRGALVTKSAVDAAAAEAEQKQLEFGIAVVTNLLGAGVEAAATHLNPGELQKALPKMSAEGGTPETAAEIDKLRAKLNARGAGPEPPAAADAAAAKAGAKATGPMKSWDGVPIADRQKAIADVVNVRLASDGVPPIEAEPFSGGGANFDKRSWKMNINRKLLESDAISQSEFDMLVENGYHEARHAKQYWQIARMKAGDGTYADAAEMAQKLGLKEGVAREAWGNKMLSNDPLYGETQELWQSFYGTGAARRNEVVGKINEWAKAQGVLADKTKALEGLKKTLGSTPPAEGSTELFNLKKAEMEVSMAEEAYDAARKAGRAVYPEYRALPEEAQAWKAGEEKLDWARRGLAARTRVRAAEAKLDSARGRLDGARKRIASTPKGDPALEGADVERALAEDDVANAEVDLALARDYSALDTWDQAGTK